MKAGMVFVQHPVKHSTRDGGGHSALAGESVR